MSELREELLAAKIDKKRIIGIVLVAVLLISVFSSSVIFFSFLFGTQRPVPSKEKANTDYIDVETILPPLPLDWLTEIMNYLSSEQLADLLKYITPEDLANILDQISDGVVEDFDLSDFPTALLALLAAGAGEMEVFRVYNYLDLNEMSNVLWKYECFDNYGGDKWTSSAVQATYPFLSMGDYFSKYFPGPEILKIKMELTPEIGSNSMIIPSLFPIPFIMEGSINADNLDYDEITLLKDDFNSSFLDLTFFSDNDVNMTYDLFGLNLPSNDEVNNSAVEVTNPTSEYLDLINQFTQLPPDVGQYIDAWANFRTHYNALNQIIDANDNAFVKANKIRNYLQTQFTFPATPDEYQSAPEGQDSVDWFCEQGKGVWSDFASAFCVFSRAFGVASRFVDGYRTQAFDLIHQTFEVEEIYDSQEDQNTILIKLKNLYNWAEIYVPTDIYGNGMWVQMDVNLDSYGGDGGGPPLPTSFNIEVNSNFSAGYRGQVANLTATLNSTTNTSVENREITFTDYTYGIELGKVTTNQNGTASLLVDIDTSQIVGPHVIVASYLSAFNTTYYTVYGDIDVNLVSVNPTEINRSITNTTNIQGFVYDPIATQRVKNATVEFLLLEPGTNNKIGFPPFDITYVNTDINGDFNEYVNVDPSVPKGNYEIRVDFNGSWGNFPIPFPVINDSSNRIEFNVTEELTYIPRFYINGTPTEYPFSPILGNLINVKRGEQLNLSVTLIDESTMLPTPGKIIEFYDYTNGDVIISSDTTNSYGKASILYNIVNSHKSGPTLVYAKYGGDLNYSYYILNESIAFDFFYGPTPRVINRTGSYDTEFDISCRLIDDQNNLMDFTQIDLRMYKGVVDRSDFLDPPYPIFYDSGGIFNINNMGVQTYTDATNYTLYLNFYGDYRFSNDPTNPYPYDFNIIYLGTTFILPNQLKVIDPDNVNITLAIEGQPTRTYYDESNNPVTYNTTTTAHFQVNVSHVFELDEKLVYIYDDFTNTELQNYSFPIGTGLSGFVQFNISTALLHAGLHKIRVQYHTFNTINTTYIVINDTININAYSSETQIFRSTENFIVYGSIQESGEPLRGLNVTLVLLNSSNDDVSFYLNLAGPQSIIINNDGTYSFTINFIDLTCPQGAYNIRIDFNGSIRYPDIISPEVLLTDYMIHASSLPIPLNIIADTDVINGNYETKNYKQGWWYGDDCYVYGNLIWDNGSAIVNKQINVTIRDGNGNILDTKTALTDGSGFFNITFTVGSWLEDTEVWVYFFPEDPVNFGPDGLYVDSVSNQLTRKI